MSLGVTATTSSKTSQLRVILWLLLPSIFTVTEEELLERTVETSAPELSVAIMVKSAGRLLIPDDNERMALAAEVTPGKIKSNLTMPSPTPGPPCVMTVVPVACTAKGEPDKSEVTGTSAAT